MIKSLLLLRASTMFILFVGTFSLLTSGVNAQEDFTKEEIHKIIREYLIQNPEIFLEVQQSLEQKQQAELEKDQRKTIAENQELIFSSPYQIEFGDRNAKKVIVEFFDYNCGFCQRALGDMQQFLASDPDVRFVLKEFPVLGEPSLDASRVSLAFSKLKPDLYSKFHTELISLEGLKDGERAIQLAEQMGATREELVEKMEDPEIFQAIQEIYELANGLGVTGTPSYIVGNDVVFGAVGYTRLKEAMANPQ